MIATNIEQSEHLLELGLDPKTADMFWKYSASLGNTDINGRIAVSYHDNLFVGKYDGAIPAWSLSALLEVMRKLNAVTTLQVTSLSTFMRSKDMGFIWQHDVHINDTVTAAYQMVCWLLEQGLIKK